MVNKNFGRSKWVPKEKERHRASLQSQKRPKEGHFPPKGKGEKGLRPISRREREMTGLMVLWASKDGKERRGEYVPDARNRRRKKKESLRQSPSTPRYGQQIMQNQKRESRFSLWTNLHNGKVNSYSSPRM